MTSFVLPANTDALVCHDGAAQPAAEYAPYVAIHPAGCTNVYEIFGETTIRRLQRTNGFVHDELVKVTLEMEALKAKHETQIEDAANEVYEERDKRYDVEAELKKRDAQLAAVQKMFQDALAAQSVAERQVAVQEQLLREQQISIQEVTAKYSEELAKNKAVELALHNECKAYAVLRNEQNVLESYFEETKKERAELKTEVARLRESLTARGSSAKVIENEMTQGKRLRDSSSMLSKRVSEEVVDVHEHCKEAFHRFRLQAAEYERERNEANKREENATTKVKHLEREIGVLQEQVIELFETRDRLEEEIQERDVAISKYREALPATRAANLRNASEARKKATELEATRARLAAVTAEAQRDDEAAAKALAKTKKLQREMKRLENHMHPGREERKEKLRKK